ncbi:MAG TPA: alpha/beta hydrolase [Acidimicrobiales bacterium]|nr:lipolytic protein [uncultured bacterium]
MPVTPEVRGLLNMLAMADAGPIDSQSPAEVRENYARLTAMMTREDVAAVVDRTVPGPAGDVPVRVYTPRDDGSNGSAPSGVRPVLVYFHGGGWTIGSVETHDNTCRSLANGSGAVVVSVEYRLAPEHPCPAALEDCEAAVRWVAANAGELGADAGRLAVGGDSAGGNLAALIAQRLRDGGPPIRFQLLVYPVTDLTLSHPSIDENAEGYFLEKATMLWFGRHYLTGSPIDDPADPLVSPLHAPLEALAGLPPALVVTAEYDPLRDEGEAYAAKLREAGVEATATRYDGVIHGFFQLPDVIPEGKVALDEACTALRVALA